MVNVTLINNCDHCPPQDIFKQSLFVLSFWVMLAHVHFYQLLIYFERHPKKLFQGALNFLTEYGSGKGKSNKEEPHP